MSKKLIYLVSFVLVLCLIGGIARSDVIVAENLLVDLRAEDLSYGEGVTTWPNHGSLGDFSVSGAPVVEDIDGIKAVTFDGSNWFEGPTSVSGIEGASTRSVEIWAYNPSLSNAEETMLSWAHRGGPEGSNMAFNYCSHAQWGSMAHWGGGTHDMGWWGDHSPAPAANTWWHLVYTYDGSAARVYVNGEEESVRDPIALDTHAGNIIRVAAQADDTGAGVNSAVNFTGSIAAVRIHDGVLSAADIQNNFRCGRLKASSPVPADDAILEATWVNISWKPGGFAVSHDVYFGDNFGDVNSGAEGTFQGNQTSMNLIVGFLGFACPDGLVPGTTYYWRIDEVNDTEPNSPWRGDVWSFMVPPRTAYDPNPADDAKYINTDVELNWTAGFGAKLHTVYFGDNFDDVNNAADNLPQAATTYTPDQLELEKIYYWRVDEFDGLATYKGNVWSFRTLPNVPITDPSLVGWWTLDEGSGSNALDWSGHGNHGTLNGDPQWVDGYFGGALEFDGTSDYVEVTRVVQDDFTLMAWIKTDTPGLSLGSHAYQGSGLIWSDVGGVANDFILGVLGTKLSFFCGNPDVSVNSNRDVVTGQWVNVAAVRSAQQGTISIYIDGEHEKTVAHENKGPLDAQQIIAIGGNTLDSRYFTGFIDDVRIYDVALIAEEVTLAMRGNLLLAWGPNPANGSTVYIRDATPLSWSPGDNASQHDVYFGIDRDTVTDADASDTTGVYRGRQGVTIYTPVEGVEWGGGPYYWRIDEYNTDGTISKGNVWSFTVADYIGIDDIEDYNDYPPDEIFSTWIDGWEVPTNGSLAGHPDPPFAETGNVHGGSQSMPVYYENNFKYSEITMTLVYPRDWTEEGVGVLSLWFYGDTSNAAERMYVALNSSAVVYHDDPSAAQIDTWTEWTIDLQEFTGVNLANVNTISIGFGDKNNLQAGGSGMVFFDDIRLYRPAP